MRVQLGFFDLLQLQFCGGLDKSSVYIRNWPMLPKRHQRLKDSKLSIWLLSSTKVLVSKKIITWGGWRKWWRSSSRAHMKKKPEHMITSANGRNLTNKTLTFMDGTSRIFKPNIFGALSKFWAVLNESGSPWFWKWKKSLRVNVVLSL